MTAAASDVERALRLRRDAEGLAGRFPSLLVEAERVAATALQGVHGRRRVGAGESFWQFRRYAQGDAARQIDWRRSARADVAYVRENEWEAQQSVFLWRDRSPSMDWRSADALPTKRGRAELLLLALAILLTRGGERFAMFGARPSTGPTALERMALALPAEPAAEDEVPPTANLPRHARAVVCGDLLAPPDVVESAVARVAAQGVKGVLLQVLDPAEEDLPFEGRVRFEGLEREGDELIPRVEAVRDAYRARLAAQRDSLAQIAGAAGWLFQTHRTDRPPQTALLALYNALAPER